MNKIKVSICVPAYNQTIYLRRTLNSILRQDYPNHEIIITDDTPSNKVKNLVDKYNFKGKLKYYKNSTIRGSPENWNEAIRQAKGEYIKILHHDDWFIRKDSLKKFVELLDNNPQANFAFSASLVLDIKNNTKRIHRITKKQLNQIKSNPGCLYFMNLIGAPSATIYRNKFKDKFDQKLKWLVDIDYYIRILSQNSNLVYCSDELICTPLGVKGQITPSCINNKRVELYEYMYLFKKLYAKDETPEKTSLNFFKRLFQKHQVKSLMELNVSFANSSPQKAFLEKALQYSSDYNYLYATLYHKALRIGKGVFKYVFSGKN